MRHLVYFPSVLVLSLICIQPQLCSSTCPGGCTCSTTQHVICRPINGNLTALTTHLPVETTRLTLLIQNFSEHQNYNMSADTLAPLRNLSHLTVIPEQGPELRIKAELSLDAMTFKNHTSLHLLKLNLPLALPAQSPDLVDLYDLDTLNLSYTSNMRRHVLDGIFPSLNGSLLRRLLLRNFQGFRQDLTDADMKINFSEWLRPLKDCPLEYLDISHNRLQYIGVGLIKNAPNLRWIDVSENFLALQSDFLIFWDVFFHPMLEIIHCSQQVQVTRRGQRHVDNSDLRELLNIVCSIDLPESWDIPSIIANETLLCAIGRCFGNETANCSEAIDFCFEHFDQSCTFDIVLPLGRNLREIYFSDVAAQTNPIPPDPFLYDICIDSSGLVSIDISNNPGLKNFLAINNVDPRGFENIQSLDLSNIGFDMANSSLMNRFTELRKLHLSGNTIRLNTRNSTTSFLYNTKLTRLTLSNCQLEYIPTNEFVHLKKLEFLDLSNNGIANLSFRIANLSHLSTLDISSNSLTHINQLFREGLDRITEGRDEVEIDMSNNPLICGCHYIDFVQWFQQSNITFRNISNTWCTQPGMGRVKMKEVNIGQLHETCFPPVSKLPIIAVSTTLCVVLFGIAIFTSWKHRWQLRHWNYRTFGNGRHPPNEDRQEYRYDGFIVYSSEPEDRRWVHHTLREEMEEKRGLKLCIYLRDILAGGPLADRISTAIDESRKTVIIVTPNFVASEWCQFDMYMAENKLMAEGIDVTVPVLLKSLPVGEVNRAVSRLMQTHDYLEWTDHPDGQKLFWDKLENQLLTDPKRPLRA